MESREYYLSMESGSDDATTSSLHPLLPPGFRFHPTDEELVVHYLKRKEASDPLPVPIIAEVALYKYDPWELPGKAAFGEREWYFFTRRDRKYPNGARPNRTATSGYWKATGTDKPVWTARGTLKVGVKKSLVFYEGKPPKGNKTNWIMHEYRFTDNKSTNKPPAYNTTKNKGSLRLDEWVLCRIYKKSNMHKPVEVDGGGGDLIVNEILAPPPSYNHQGLMKPTIGCTGYDAMESYEHNHHHHLNTVGLPSSAAYTKMFLTDRSPVDTQLQPQTMVVAPGESILRQPYQSPYMNNWYS